MNNKDFFFFWAACALVACTALSFDLSQPLGVAGGIPYILLVLLALLSDDYRAVVVLTLVATGLTLLGYALSSPMAPLQVVILNRGLALFAIWTVAGAVTLVIMQRRALELQTHIDTLTETYNRKYLLATLRREISVWRREGRPLSLIMVDIDHFKSVNDNHGHPAGDRVLRKVVQICKANVRTADWVCRFGGEEFVIVLPNTSRRKAADVAERIREAVSKARFMSDNVNFALTVSLGVAEMHRSYGGADVLLCAADNALYGAKNAGRNQVRIEEPARLLRFPARAPAQKRGLASEA